MDTVTTKKKDSVTFYEIEGPLFEKGDDEQGKFWIATEEIGKYCNRGQTIQVAQFYKLVPGLILTRHVFEGLDRPLFCDNKMDGDKNKFVFSRKPTWDYIWEGGSFFGEPIRKKAPDKSVFVVIISKNERHRDKFPEVDGWIERWNWVEESKALNEAPRGWVDRYTDKIWTRR